MDRNEFTDFSMSLVSQLLPSGARMGDHRLPSPKVIMVRKRLVTPGVPA